ncbi:MAG: histidine kinase [Sphingomonas bacterium]|uniref:ATP-binding protein n=1 Tax=Sphingomonas bacterium TaxID=1895847 RepID=UPI00262CF1ED|nr:ATP-binding protein [Sphingomonas bacterium]MDB5712551.1 histidine kinase [Sphingomonas bacterium]
MGRIISSRTLVSFLVALMLAVGIATPSVTVAAPVAASATTSFDAMVADAKAAMMVDPHQTIAKAQAAQVVARRVPSAQRVAAIATTQWLQGEAYLRLDDAKHAGPLIQQALAAVGNARPATKLNGDILLSLGGYHTAIADVANALDDYQRAHNIFRDIGETRSRAVALLYIALLYQEAKDWTNALKYYDQVRDVYHGEPQLLLQIYNNRGNALKEIGRYAEAEAQFREALALARPMNNPALVARVLSNIARSQIKSGHLDAAEQTIAQGFALGRGGGETAAATEQFWGIAAQAALQRGELQKARTLIERSFAHGDDSSLSAREGHETAYAIYRKLGDEKNALLHLEAFKKFDDKTSQLASSANTALAAARFDFANQELKITKLQRDDERRKADFERARAQTQLYVFVGLGVVTVIIVTMLGFGLVTIRRSRNEVRAANIDLGHTNSALAKALAAKTEFLATTSHEIRTPLNGILGMTQVMLADRTLTEALRDRIGVVHGAGITMRTLVDDILDVAKMETGNLTIEQAAFDLRATLTDLSRMWQEQAQVKGITFALDLADCPQWIEGDAARLRQVAFNLLSNALKFTEAGTVTLRAAEAAGPDGPLLRIDIVDTGIGIAADKHELIFESFRQADGGTTRKFGGTGLGLSICRNLARAMQGDVTVDSAERQGAIFTLALPLIHATAPEAASAQQQAETSALLIVDRNPITRAMLRTMLEPRAGVVLFASSVDEAVERIAAGGIVLALADEGTVKAADDVDTALAALVQAAAEAGTATALLWAGLDDAQRENLAATGISTVIAKPIAGPALAALLYPGSTRDDSAPNHLATHAA